MWAGLLGMLVMTTWAFVTNVVFGLQPRLQMQTVPNERAVYSVLKESVTKPGSYMSNPEVDPRAGYPAGEPVFRILYSGVGHDSAGWMMIVELAIGFVAATIASWLLVLASQRKRLPYLKRVLFFFGIGLFLAVFSDLQRFGIGGNPIDLALWLAANHVATWTLAGIAMALVLKPPETGAAVL